MGETGQLGPLSEAQILDLAENAVLVQETLVWKVGMASWAPAASIPRLAERLRPTWTPPPVAVPPPLAPAPGSSAGPQSIDHATCPRDGSVLRRESRAGVEIDWCPTCRGVWLDRGELEKLIQREARDYDDDDDNRRSPRGRKGFFGDLFDAFD